MLSTQNSLKLHCICVLWGEKYLKTYLTYALPLQLLPDNLGVFKKNEIEYHFYTTELDALKLRQSPIFSELETKTSVFFHLIDLGLGSIDKYALMNRCHCEALKKANLEDAALVILSPDCLLLNGAFREIKNQADRGIRAVVIAAPRLNLDTLETAIHGKKIETISNSEWISLALNHLHPLTHSLLWNTQNLNEWIAHLYWKPTPSSFIVCGFHQHPIFIWPENKSVLPKISLDDSFLSNACPNQEKWTVIESSDQIACFEVSRSNAIQFVTRAMKEKDLVHWILRYTGSNHRIFVQTPYIISNNPKDPLIKPALLESQQVIRRLLDLAKTPTIGILLFFLGKIVLEIVQRIFRRLKKILLFLALPIYHR